jgi:hypothetical protein
MITICGASYENDPNGVHDQNSFFVIFSRFHLRGVR